MSSARLWMALGSLLVAAMPTPGAAQPTPPDEALAPAVSTVAPAMPDDRRCPEGRGPSGRCVNPALALAGRDRRIVFTQPRLSFLAPPRVLPSATVTSDRLFRSPNNPITDADVEISRILGLR
ncbi:hypothetical protein [Methylobacterium nonmethylotrophicum]|uniref:Porin n=1 Tax=Methylobacterium nonmethylotrophicum TaxID=1141884 RepID=A0A4Z0NM83_9HYPH|nr:hypothetical protein [Methylobacterium nonmethylotrophicum]TGD97421.1 hypothetical protein EU555_19840 [Methylobacterium nonmethylotrophicum]